MNKEVLWDNRIAQQFGEENYEKLDSFLELLHLVEDMKISDKISTELFYDEKLWNWLSSKEQIDLRDIKKELLIRINKAEQINEQEYKDYISNVGKLTEKRKFVFCFHNENVFYISTLDEYYCGLRKYLSFEKKSDFCEDMLECFPNLFFVEDIASTINTLQRDFDDLKEEIVEHLTAINNYHAKFEKLLIQNKSNQSIAHEFFCDTGIECSPQAARNGVRCLKLLCFNTISQQNETIKCELHTKFKKYNTDITKQNRIYFFPGKTGIYDGKIIIKHIGKHL